MRRLAISALLLAACGRFGFDAGTGSGSPGDSGNVGGDASDGQTAQPFTSCDEAFAPNDHFVASTSIGGQNGWFLEAPGLFDEEIANIGAAAHGGTGVWHVTNTFSSTAFGNMPMGPELAQSAGESSVRSAGGGDTMEWVFWFRSRNAIADGSAIGLYMSPPSGDRLVMLELTNDRDAANGFRYSLTAYSGTTTLGTTLPRTTWMKLRVVLHAIDGDSNDVVDVLRDGTKIGTYSSWDGYFYANPPLFAVNRVMFRINRAPSSVNNMFPDAAAQGFDIDDLCYRVYSSSAPTVTIAGYRTGFEP